MAKIYKSPLQQSLALKAKSLGVPDYDANSTKKYLENYGDGFTDDAYEEWALKKGKTLNPKKPLNPEFAQTDFAKQHYGGNDTYYDQYINDDEWLQEYWKENYPEIIEYIDYVNQGGK